MVDLKIHRLDKEVELPVYAHKEDAALDLRSAEDTILKAGEKKLIRTGIRVAIPKEHVGLIWDRSGLAAKNSIHVLAGVIDSNYRGEISIVLKNLGNEDLEIKKNHRIAQMLIQPVINPNIIETEQLDETERNADGFGSTGVY